jgi:ParB-like chromosome segregation protein Spo0J
MSEKSKQPKAEEKLLVREQVALETKEVPFESLVCRPEEYSFRDGDDLSQKSLQSLADDIAANGLISPLLVQEENGKYLVLNGNRRYGAMSLLVEKQIIGWTPKTLIKVQVMPAGTKKVEVLARAISANVYQKPLSGFGRARAALALHREGMPNVQIAAIFDCNVKTIERDLSMATFPKFMQLVEDHAIQFSTAASLLEKAKKAKKAGMAEKTNRVTELYDAIQGFAVDMKRKLQKESAAQVERGGKPYTEEKLWPQRYLGKSQTAAWENALISGEPLEQGSSVSFSAQVKKEHGVHKAVVSSLSLDVLDAPLDHVKQVAERATIFAYEMKEVLRKRANEARAEEAAGGGAAAAARAAFRADLAKMGIDDIVSVDEPETEGEDDAEFDKKNERQEVDALDDVDGEKKDAAQLGERG